MLGQEVVKQTQSTVQKQVCSGDIEVDCPEGQDEPVAAVVINNNSKDISTDAVPDTISDEENASTDDFKVMTSAQTETQNQNILRKTSRDAGAQTKSRESRDSFRCRGCGIESNRKRFEEEMEGREFDRDNVNQRSMSETFQVRSIRNFFSFSFFLIKLIFFFSLCTVFIAKVLCLEVSPDNLNSPHLAFCMY